MVGSAKYEDPHRSKFSNQKLHHWLWSFLFPCCFWFFYEATTALSRYEASNRKRDRPVSFELCLRLLLSLIIGAFA
jgi:hypothetical protein